MISRRISRYPEVAEHNPIETVKLHTEWNTLVRSRAGAVAAAACLLCLTGMPGLASAEWFSDQQNKMGTHVGVELWHEDEDAAQELITAAMAEFDRIESTMSTYIADTEISRVNRFAAAEPVPVSRELFELIGQALKLSETTGGLFDITYDSVGSLYDYRAGVHPTENDIEQRLGKIDYRHVLLDDKTTSIRFAVPGVRINLGGIAKGHAVERVVMLLREAGVRHALVNAGGDTRLLGDRLGRPWIVGIRDPDDEKGLVMRLALEDEAISTSGDYERFFIEDGVRYHHILTPRTGKSPGELRSATVVGPDGTMTDGLSTSVFVAGLRAGLELIESQPDYEAVIVDARHRIHFSSGLDPQ